MLHVTLAADASLPGARAAVLLRQAGAAARVAFTVPAQDVITAGTAGEFLVGIDPPDGLGGDDIGATLAALGGAARSASPTWPRSVERRRPDPDGPELAAADGAPVPERDAAPDRAPPAGSAGATTVRVEASRLDALLDVAGELVIERNRLDALVDDTADADVKRALADLRRTVGDLERLVQRVRMVPIAPVFTRLQRLVRETARDLGTPVDLHIVGARPPRSTAAWPTRSSNPWSTCCATPSTTGSSRRTCGPSGASPSGDRCTCGPSSRATTSSSRSPTTAAASTRSASRPRPWRRGSCIERRPSPPSIAPRSSTSSSRPGFSTNEDVSLVSGRGVGLDVVRAAVNRFGGGIEVDSEPGVGTTFRIRLPLSLVVVARARRPGRHRALGPAPEPPARDGVGAGRGHP